MVAHPVSGGSGTWENKLSLSRSMKLRHCGMKRLVYWDATATLLGLSLDDLNRPPSEIDLRPFQRKDLAFSHPAVQRQNTNSSQVPRSHFIARGQTFGFLLACQNAVLSARDV